MKKFEILLAGCAIADESGLLLLHRNTSDCQQWELPGGKVAEDETSADAAARETLEELGVHVQVGNKLATTLFKQNDQSFAYDIFPAVIIGGEPQVKEPRLHDKIGRFTLRQLSQMEQLSPNILRLRKLWTDGEIVIGS